MMNMEKKIEEMERDLIDSVEHETLFDVDFYTTSKNLIAKGYRKVVMCKDCAYCEERHYEVEGERPYVKLTCKWNSYSHHPNDYCGCAKMKGE